MRQTHVDLADAEILVAREAVRAVLIDSPFGELWLCVDPTYFNELAAEEQFYEPDSPRPILTPDDVAKLRHKSPNAVRAALRAIRTGTRILQ